MNDYDLNGLSVRLKGCRKNRNISTTDAAERLYTSRVSLWEYETGKRIPPVDMLLNMTQVYNVSLDYLLGKKIEAI